MKTSNKRVAIILLNYKSWEDTLTEVETIHRLFHVDWKDVIVVDNCSPNESAEKLEKAADKRFILIKSKKNDGYAAGNNIGLRYAVDSGFDYAWILNNDIIIDDPDLITQMLEVFDHDPNVAVVNPDIYAPDGHMFNRDAVRYTFLDMTLGILHYRKKGRRINDLGGYGYVYRPQGCCMMIDLKKSAAVGHLDDHTFLYCEEVILAERLLRKQYRCACCYLAKVIHNHSTTVKSVLSKKNIIRINMQSFRYYLTEYRMFGKIKTELCCLFGTIKLWLLG